MKGFLNNKIKEECFGCEACVNVCNNNAILMKEDSEGFRYPAINNNLCIECKACHKVCPSENMPLKHKTDKYVFGGYSLDEEIRFKSTSGGAFSMIVDAFCDENYVVFGAEAKGLIVFHGYITDKRKLNKFRKSKYSQSIIGMSYKKAKKFLEEGKKVLFSGTPCQIAGLKAYLAGTGTDQKLLLTVEVICEGVPSPLYMRKLEKYIKEKYDANIKNLDYRYKGKSLIGKSKWDFQLMKLIFSCNGKCNVGGGRWDFEEMKIVMKKDKKIIIKKKDRWFNPFWSIWLQHLISRPCCYKCPFTTTDRLADITLGDLWGVHIYCPELYGKNGGASLIICNTKKGEQVFKRAERYMYGHKLQFEDALKYQSPMRKHIDKNPKRKECMHDLKSPINYKKFTKKWAKKPSLKLLWSKYIYGNRQKVWLWNLKKWYKNNK